MFIVNTFRSGNTLRITLPRSVRQALNIQPKDHIALKETRPGVFELTNASVLLENRQTPLKT